MPARGGWLVLIEKFTPAASDTAAAIGNLENPKKINRQNSGFAHQAAPARTG